jgi:hypothetical protein
MVKKCSGKTSSIAICQDCSWRNEDRFNAQATAVIHAKKYCHLVLVETVIASRYDGQLPL